MPKIFFALCCAVVSVWSQNDLWNDIDQGTLSSSSLDQQKPVSSVNQSSSSALILPKISSEQKLSSALSQGQVISSSSSALSSSVLSSSSVFVPSEAMIRRALRAPDAALMRPITEGDTSDAPVLPAAPKQSILKMDSLVSKDLKLPESITKAELLGNVRTTRVESLSDDSKYRSVRTAFLLSLFIPGSGQAYVGGTGAWLRGALYFGAEAALWATWYTYSIQGAQDYADRASELVKSSWNAEQNETKLLELFKKAELQSPEAMLEFEAVYIQDRRVWCEALYGRDPRLTSTVSACRNIAKNDFSNHVTLLLDPNWKAANQGQYLKQLEDSKQVLGWKDLVPTDWNELVLNGGEAKVLGQSASQAQYNKYRQEERERRESSSMLLTGIALNHMISALDAALTARSYNRGLYQKPAGLKMSMPIQPTPWGVQASLRLSGNF